MELVLTPQQVQRFRKPQAARLALDLALAWTQIGAGLAAFWLAPSAPTFALAFVLVAGGQQGLRICTHEFAHALALPGNRRWNDWLGRWLFAAPAGLPFLLYRHRHLKHHRLYSTQADPKTVYRRDVRGLRFWVLIVRNLCGYEALYQGLEALAQSGREATPGPRLRAELPGLALVQAAVFCAFLSQGTPLWWAALWLAPLLTLVPLFENLRAIAEHQPASPGARAPRTDFFRETAAPFARSLRPSLLERLTLSRMNFGYHAEHHHQPEVSYQHLPELSELIQATAGGVEHGRSYWSALRKLRRDEPGRLSRDPVPNVPLTKVPRCPVCGSSGSHPLFCVQDHEYDTTTSADFAVASCNTCGAWYLDPRPASAALDLIYPPNYHAHVMPAAIRSRLARGKRAPGERSARRRFLRQMAPLARHLDLGPRTRVLDVGCGGGDALAWLREAHDCVGVGIDPSEAAVRLCVERGVEAHVARFESFDAKGEHFDLILGSRVIEHVESPLAFTAKALKLLEPGGVLALVTANTASWEARVLGPHWGALQAPRSFSLLHEGSARELASRAGFEHLATVYGVSPETWIRSLHSLLQRTLGRDVADGLVPADHRIADPTLANALRRLALGLLDRANRLAFGQTASMLLVFRKPA